MSETTGREKLLGAYIVEHGATVRAAAKAFGISKSTVHTDVTEVLRGTDAALWRQVRHVLDVNKDQRHLRGGAATREKYRQERERKNLEETAAQNTIDKAPQKR